MWGSVTGARIESAWRALNAAEQELLMLLPAAVIHERIPGIRAALRNMIPPGDPRLGRYTADLDALETRPRQGARDRIARWWTGVPRVPRCSEADRSCLRSIKRDIDDAGDAAHEKVRTFRNVVFVFGTLLSVFLVAVAIAHAGNPRFFRICEAPPSSASQSVAAADTCNNYADVATIEALGALGGLLAALLVLARLDTVTGAYNLAIYPAALRIPAGAITALFGVFVLQGGALGAFATQDNKSLLAYAALFGYSPDLLLRLIDKRANGVLDQARVKQDPESRPPPPKMAAKPT